MYKPVPREMDLPSIETKMLRFWEDTNAFEKLRERLKGSPKRFSFIDGPITANNRMGVHHAWGRTYKDLFQRYRAMTGHDQRWQNGFDCQGLWVEVGVERELGFNTKRDIEAYGIGPFVQRCKERVLKFARVQSDQSVRLGYWMRWDDSYYTMSEDNNYTIWQMLKTCHERGWLYRGHDSMPWCPRCGTGISQHEIETEGYRDVTHTSLYVKLPLLDRPGENLLVWTTTPWTLPANVAAAVHPDLTYVRARKGEEAVYLVEPLAEKLLGPDWQIEQRVRGEEMVGWRYRGPFDELPAQAEAREVHQVILWKDVSQEEGTGIVHIAPGAGAEDFQLGKALGLPAIAPLAEDGTILEGFDWLTGRYVGDVAKPVEEALREKGLLFRSLPYTHRYPHCWRCETELVFRLVDEWFISMDELRHEMMEVTKQIRWIPDFGLDRELDWLKNMHDWMISKKRYWGLALPIWRCEACDRFEVIGSRKELRERAIEGWEAFEGHAPHRPSIDAIKVACGGCGLPIGRIPDVGNPWLDAGIVAYSTLGYATDREHWEQWFPADFITESFPGQYRNWFYAMLVMSTVLEKKPPFRTVLGFATLRGEDGRAMHKSWGNDLEFNEAAATVGADILRWTFCLQNPTANLNFGWNVAHATQRRLLKLWDSYRFFSLYAIPDRWQPGSAPPPAERSEMDRWLLSVLQTVVQRVRAGLEEYDPATGARAIEEFFEDLSNWYIRRSRERFWAPGGRADGAALATLHEALITLAKLMAPFAPFLAEELYQNLVRAVDDSAPESVHHCEFPEVQPELVDSTLMERMDWVRTVASLGHSARKQNGISLRRPLLAIRVASSTNGALSDSLLRELADELNVKTVQLVDGLPEAVRQRVEPNPKLLGPKYGSEYPRIRQALQAGRFTVDETGRVHVGSWLLEPEEASVSLEPAEGYAAAVDRGVLVVLDTTITPELQAEGRAREVVRIIQDARKEANLEVTDRIEVAYEAPPELHEAIAAQADYVKRETLTLELGTGPMPDSVLETHGEIDGMPIRVAFRRAEPVPVGGAR